MDKKKIKYRLFIEIYEVDGRAIIHHDSEEEDATMRDIGLVLYKLKQIEQEFIDRRWVCETGYEITGDDDNEEEEN